MFYKPTIPLIMKFPLRFAVVLACFVAFLACKKGFDSTSFTPEEIGRYIAARVPAAIEPGDAVRIRFSVPVDTSRKDGVYAFSPDIKGHAWWEDALTLAFLPDGGWQPATKYQLQVSLDKVIADVDPK